MKKKDKIIKDKIVTTRVTTQVYDTLNFISKKNNITKCKVVSDLITDKYKLEQKTGKITQLEHLFFRISIIVDSDYNEYTKTTTPCILKADEEIDGDYFGKLQILVGDDTCIREKNGKFYVLDFHNEKDEIELLDEQEILDFYEGKQQAYEMPMLKYKSYQYIKGYVEVATRLLASLEYFLEDKETERETETRLKNN